MVMKGRSTRVAARLIAGAVGAAMTRRRAKAPSKSKAGPSRRTRLRRRTRGGRTKTTRSGGKKVFAHASQEQQFSRMRTQGRGLSLRTLVMSAMERSYLRVQGLTQFDVTQGFYPLANRTLAGTGLALPCHVWDITSQPNVNGAGSLQNPDVGFALGLASSAANANTATYTLPCNDASGNAVTSSCTWIQENVAGTGDTSTPLRKSMHEWTHIKLNLYGVRQRATRFVVDLMMVKEEYADFLDASNTNAEKRKLFSYLTWPFVFNNLNQGDVGTAGRYVRRVKTYEVIIDPIQTTDLVQVPRIQTVNWFVRHNRVRHYDWNAGDGVPANYMTGPRVDTETGTQLNTRVEPKHRLYLVLRAMCPTVRTLVTGESLANTAPDPVTEPSYDLLLRNKFVNPR